MSRSARAIVAAAAVGLSGAAALGQLAQDQVLVIYDSRVQGSREVAEFYAGSAKVPGGVGTYTGARPGVRVVDLSTLPNAGMPCASPPCAATPDISYADFASRFRDPLKTYLTTQGLDRRVRCLVLTKGLPHRVLDTDAGAVGDNPGAVGTEFNNGDLTYCSLDSELSLLMTALDTGEAGGSGDSRADGMIINPYWKATQPITASRTLNIRATKNITNLVGIGQIWRAGTGTLVTTITPGDMYLVCRLDGPTVADVHASITRAQSIVLDENTALFLLDEAGGSGTQNLSDTDQEFDNDGPTQTNNGDDYEQTRDLLIADRRWLAANIRYDFAAGAAGFFVGPLVSFGGGLIVNGTVAHLATLGNNHNGGVPGSAGSQYAQSFNYMPGAVFNTIESYNGRAFGGLGTIVGQEQLSDFLGAGGTLGVGNVWEPFSLSVADNVLIAQNFWLGGSASGGGALTWAEAAYSSLPVLSWQQVVVGDPLATVVRKREDLTGDNRVNIDDLYAWFESASPPDLNRDGTVDSADYALLERSVRASELTNMNGTPNGEQQD